MLGTSAFSARTEFSVTTTCVFCWRASCSGCPSRSRRRVRSGRRAGPCRNARNFVRPDRSTSAGFRPSGQQSRGTELGSHQIRRKQLNNVRRLSREIRVAQSKPITPTGLGAQAGKQPVRSQVRFRQGRPRGLLATHQGAPRRADEGYEPESRKYELVLTRRGPSLDGEDLFALGRLKRLGLPAHSLPVPEELLHVMQCVVVQNRWPEILQPFLTAH